MTFLISCEDLFQCGIPVDCPALSFLFTPCGVLLYVPLVIFCYVISNERREMNGFHLSLRTCFGCIHLGNISGEEGSIVCRIKSVRTEGFLYFRDKSLLILFRINLPPRIQILQVPVKQDRVVQKKLFDRLEGAGLALPLHSRVLHEWRTNFCNKNALTLRSSVCETFGWEQQEGKWDAMGVFGL